MVVVLTGSVNSQAGMIYHKGETNIGQHMLYLKLLCPMAKLEVMFAGMLNASTLLLREER